MREVKKSLRKELISRRRNMEISEKQAADRAIFELVKPLIDKADSVLTYISTEIEVDTHLLMQYCFDNGIRVAAPVSGDSELTFYEVKSFDDVSEGRFGISEPTDRSREFSPTAGTLCIVPALCADEKGLRLGYGRGYYDRFLSSFEGTSAILCYSGFRMEVPSEPHDKRADITVFDDKIIYKQNR